MPHPFEWQLSSQPEGEVSQIIVKLELSTLYKRLPYGLAIMSYTDPDLERLSFRGVGVFKKGKLQQGPFTFIRGDGYGRSFTRMINRDAIPGTENYNLTTSCQRIRNEQIAGVTKPIFQAFNTTQASSMSTGSGTERERDGKIMAISTSANIKTTRGVRGSSACSRTTALTPFIKSNT